MTGIKKESHQRHRPLRRVRNKKRDSSSSSIDGSLRCDDTDDVSMVIDVDAGGDCGSSATISSLSSMSQSRRSRRLLGRLSGTPSVEVTDIPYKPPPQPELRMTPPCSRLKSSSISTLPSSSSSSALMSSTLPSSSLSSALMSGTNRSPYLKNMNEV